MISFSFILLIVAGIFVIKKNKYAIHLYRIFASLLLIDSIIRFLFFLDEFPPLVIAIEALIGLIFLMISFDNDLNFVEKYKKVFNTLMLYPSPTTDHLNISFKSQKLNNLKFKILNLTGVKLMQGAYSANVGDNNIAIDVSGIASGMYILSLYDGKQILSKKYPLDRLLAICSARESWAIS